MDTKQTRIYHAVQFLAMKENAPSGIRCVPDSWIKSENQTSTAVLTAYPDESQEITRERVKVYDGPGGYWNLHWAEIKYTTNFYDSVIQDINKHDHSVAGFSGNEVNFTENESPNSSPSLQTWLGSEVNHSTVFWPELQRQLDEDTDSDDSQSLMVNTINEVTCIDSEVSDKEYIDIEEMDVPLDLSKPPKTIQKLRLKSLQDLQEVSNTNDSPPTSYRPLNEPAYNSFRTSSDTNDCWTLKHPEYLPGLVELLPNTSIYIEKSKLDYCLIYSKKRSQLARLLTLQIFSESALKTCVYINNIKGPRDRRLSPAATAAIVKFVQIYGDLKNWEKSNMYDIKGTMRHQLLLCKQKCNNSDARSGSELQSQRPLKSNIAVRAWDRTHAWPVPVVRSLKHAQ